MNKPVSKRLVFAAIAAFAVPPALWIAWGFWGVQWVASNLPNKLELATLGQTGDLFGGVNALFAAFAFAGVLVAAFFQFRTNQHAQHTLEVTLQAQTLASFEPLFFKLLERHDQMYAALRLELRGVIGSAFPGPNAGDPATLAYWLREQVKSGQDTETGAVHEDAVLSDEDYAWVSRNFDEMYITNEHVLGPFYRTTYHLFNLIDKSALSESDKVRYANIARSAMNRDELLLLMLNCAHPRGANMKTLVERYGLLKHISTDRRTNALDVALAATLFHPNARRSAEDRAHQKP
ncbi:putative phage abortive infection protein [Hydrogenophaga crocea]|uniref:Phage abortive infection protein n=1 Tax=Hydrogenophaga crocea TaxID=2716225 RepID=A0A6G8IJ23_9BURK|nr:putative phage abortive infection protein [Hydrogenophaga crocea]QIM53025.1 hypothetical protein G9Q37_13160 [Hydrogenophaga crocea]